MLMSALLTGCEDAALAETPSTQSAAAPPPPPVQVSTAVRRQVTDWDTFTGRFEAPQRVVLRPRVSGYIDAATFEEGSLVEKGQVLFRIDPRPYLAVLDRATAELARAEAQHQLAGRELERAENLLRSQVISREEYDRRRSQHSQMSASLDAARAAVESAKLDTEFTDVLAPIGGRVSRADVTPGNYVTAGSTRLTTLVSVNPIYVYFEGDEQTFLRYARQTRDEAADSARTVRVGLTGEQGFPHDGHLDFMDNALDPATGTIRARAVLNNPVGRFTPGMFARVQVVNRAGSAATLIDPRAIGTDQDRRFVYVVDDNNALHYRAIEPGEAADGLRVVRSGLEAGERVVVGSLAMLRPGMKVQPRPKPSPATDDDDGNAIAMK
jgi:RND family efflux transporter MFP subunit